MANKLAMRVSPYYRVGHSSSERDWLEPVVGGEIMNLKLLLAITVALWLLVVIAIGYWRLDYAWHWGDFLIFFFHSLPLLVLSLGVIIIVEALLFRAKN